MYLVSNRLYSKNTTIYWKKLFPPVILLLSFNVRKIVFGKFDGDSLSFKFQIVSPVASFLHCYTDNEILDENLHPVERGRLSLGNIYGFRKSLNVCNGFIFHVEEIRLGKFKLCFRLLYHFFFVCLYIDSMRQ